MEAGVEVGSMAGYLPGMLEALSSTLCTDRDSGGGSWGMGYGPVGRVLAIVCTEPWFLPVLLRPGVAVYSHNPSTWEVVRRGGG